MRAPLGMPLATAGVSGARADAPLSVPGRARVHTRVGRGGLVWVGAGTRAAQAPRAGIAVSEAEDGGPRPPVPRAAGAWEAARERGWHGAHARRAVLRALAHGAPTRRAQGGADEGPMRRAVVGPSRA